MATRRRWATRAIAFFRRVSLPLSPNTCPRLGFFLSLVFIFELAFSLFLRSKTIIVPHKTAFVCSWRARDEREFRYLSRACIFYRDQSRPKSTRTYSTGTYIIDNIRIRHVFVAPGEGEKIRHPRLHNRNFKGFSAIVCI